MYAELRPFSADVIIPFQGANTILQTSFPLELLQNVLLIFSKTYAIITLQRPSTTNDAGMPGQSVDICIGFRQKKGPALCGTPPTYIARIVGGIIACFLVICQGTIDGSRCVSQSPIRRFPTHLIFREDSICREDLSM